MPFISSLLPIYPIPILILSIVSINCFWLLTSRKWFPPLIFFALLKQWYSHYHFFHSIRILRFWRVSIVQAVVVMCSRAERLGNDRFPQRKKGPIIMFVLLLLHLLFLNDWDHVVIIVEWRIAEELHSDQSMTRTDRQTHLIHRMVGTVLNRTGGKKVFEKEMWLE